MKFHCAFVLLLALLLLPGCKSASENANEKNYDIKGKVVAINTGKKPVTLDHEDIPGLMQAMQMDFAVESTAVLEGLKPGDQVEGRLKVRSGDYIITELKKR